MPKHLSSRIRTTDTRPVACRSEQKQGGSNSPPATKSLLDGVIANFTLLSSIAGAIWALWLFFHHVGEQEKEKTAQIRLSNEKLRLDNQQSELRLRTEVERGELLLAQQKLTLDQSVKSAAAEIEKLRISVGVAQLETRLKQSQVRQVEQGRVTARNDIDVQCSDDGVRYDVRHTFSGKNSSEKDVEVTYTVLYWFVGRIPDDKSPGTLQMIPINHPPIPIFGIDMNTRPIQWKLQGSVAHHFPNTKHRLDHLDLALQSGGGGTNILRQGEPIDVTHNFVVYGQSGSQIGISFVYGLDGGRKDADIRHHRAWATLPDCSKSEK